VRKTRRSLRDAFVRLILKQGYDAISIQDIANEADTARITFYRHYRDKEELLTDCLNVLYEELVQRTQRVSAEGLRSGVSPVAVLYQHIEDQETLYRILFSSRGTQIVIERLRHHLATNAITGIRAFVPPENLAAPVEILAHHVAGAQIGLAIWWLDHDKPYPSDYMAQVSVWLSLAGLLRGIGVDSFSLPEPPIAPNGFPGSSSAGEDT
jgi:AcrR family transcriptional regulator